MDATVNKNYMKGFVPFAMAAALVSLAGGFTASIPNNIVSAWGLDSSWVTWITLAMSMGMAACAPVLGKLGDIFGRRGAALVGMALMAIGELAIGMAPDGAIWMVLVARFVVGIGAAAISPTVIAYITSEFPPVKMGNGFAVYMALSSGMVIFGPTVGGLIFQATQNWRLILYICAGLAALCFVICLFTMKKETGPKKGIAGFDIFGGIFIILGFSLVLCVPTVGQGDGGWFSPASLTVIGCTVLALVILFLVERKAKNPILNGKFMARKEFILPVVVLFLTQGLMQACMTNTIRFSMMFDPTSSVASFATSIMYVGMTIGNIAVAPLSNKHEPRYISVLALVFCLIGAAIQLLFTAESGFVLFASSLFFIGLGLGGNGTIFMKVALSGLDPQIAGAGSGTYTVFRDMSAPFGVAVFSSMFVGGYAAAQQAGDAAALGAAVVSSMHNVAWAQMACVVVGMIVCLMLPKIYSKKS